MRCAVSCGAMRAGAHERQALCRLVLELCQRLGARLLRRAPRRATRRGADRRRLLRCRTPAGPMCLRGAVLVGCLFPGSLPWSPGASVSGTYRLRHIRPKAVGPLGAQWQAAVRLPGPRPGRSRADPAPISRLLAAQVNYGYEIPEVRPWGKPVLNVPNCSTPAAGGSGGVDWSGCEALLHGTLDVARRATQLLNARGKVPPPRHAKPASQCQRTAARNALHQCTVRSMHCAALAPCDARHAVHCAGAPCNAPCCRCRSSQTRRPSRGRWARRSGWTRR